MRPVIVRDDGDDFAPRERADGPRRRGFGLVLFLLVLALVGARSIAGLVIEAAWWREVGQFDTWTSLLGYNYLPVLATALTLFALLWLAHLTGMRGGGGRLRGHRGYTRIAVLIVGVASLILSAALIDSWTIVRYLGSNTVGDTWRDPVFGEPLSFYFFSLPFLRMVLRLAIGATLATMMVYWVSLRGWKLRERFQDLRAGGDIDLQELGFGELIESKLIRFAAAFGLLALAARSYLDRYDFLTEDHGFMVGMDWVARNVSLPLIWFAVMACIAGAELILAGRLVPAAILLLVAFVLPPLASRAVNFAHVRPNEISIQRPYIEHHIAGTRAAYGLDHRTREVDFAAKMDAPFVPTEHRALLDSVRLWDWQAFHDTITQIQALRPYYVFADTDVDRYHLPDPDGTVRLRQALLSPRELDVRQLPDARTRWINPHFIYTHGYGLVMAEANRITSDGLPHLFIQNAPPEIKTKGLQLNRPEIYYGEAVHEPVFVRTGQPEFNYPSGSENVHSRYEGTGGFPVGSLGMRMAAALRQSDWNILLTSYLTSESRMMIRRRVAERLETAAPFIDWDGDPYLVVTSAGRLIWMVDGYTSSNAHPYSRSLRTTLLGNVNYVRNSVKATVDAYDGNLHLYLFDPADPVIQAYARLFPRLFEPASTMPRDVREHARYPETLFRIQAEVYRTFHMKDPEAFYNKEDLWDIAKTSSNQEGSPAAGTPTYLISTMPDSTEAEFVLMVPFTPRNKDNLIGLMVARCDGDKLGEIVFLQLSKQELIFGPMQIKARINQDQNISKDLTLWNQQGSKVIRGQMQVLPIGKTFLYVEPIYLQAAQAPMPQLRKVALAIGNQVSYGDTYAQALAQLRTDAAPEMAISAVAAAPSTSANAAPEARGDRRLDEARSRMQKYRQLMAEGKFAEAGRELEALQTLLR